MKLTISMKNGEKYILRDRVAVDTMRKLAQPDTGTEWIHIDTQDGEIWLSPSEISSFAFEEGRAWI